MELKNWFMNYEEHRDVPCESPCSLYSVLLQNNWMDDPHVGMNEYAATELSGKDCEFYTRFAVGEELLHQNHVQLKFYGLDTLCTITLNGKKLASVDNMHRTFVFEVGSLLRAGENFLLLHFASPTRFIEAAHQRRKLWAGGGTMYGVPHIRKASYMFGWDWGPRLPDMGIFRRVELVAFADALLENVDIHQWHRDDGTVELEMLLEGQGDLNGIPAEARLEFSGEVVARAAFAQGEAVLSIEAPQLWWPNGYGGQPLYTLVVEAGAFGRVEKRIGLRTVTVSTKEDQYGEEFCFVVNGYKIFSMGADYIPQDNVLSRINRTRTEKLIQNCVAANYNTLRVWGGGYYPEDDFFDLCDEYGILVWQDFMFACVNIHLTERFEQNIEAELRDNMRRIRHHASLGLLCGNNEMEWGVKEWGICTNELIRTDYLRLYEKLIPDACEKYAPDVFYWPSSPSSGGGLDDPNSENRGDSHFWDVWLGDRPYTEYRKHYFRFCSEFGFESFPSRKTIRTFAREDEQNPFSPVMESHQKCNSGNTRILTNMAGNYLYASNMESLIYASQVIQADAIRYGVEHMRRFRGRCMGATYWQLNDCWPVASWSSVDYFGRWKALHYAAKRFFAPILLSAHEDGFNVVLNVSNETMREFHGRIEYAIKDNWLRELHRGTIDCTVDALSARDMQTLDLRTYLQGYEGERFLSYALFDAQGNRLSSQALLFALPKRYRFQNPDFSVSLERKGNEIFIHISSDVFARAVEIDFDPYDIVLSDNYMDITTPEGITVHGVTDLSAEELLKALRLKSVYDIR